MKAFTMKIFLRLYLLSASCCFSFLLNAQTGFSGDSILAYLGKNSSGTEISELKTAYDFQVANDDHYLTKNGIELVFKNNLLKEIHLYKSSLVYGAFPGVLPQKLHFGVSATEVKHWLGKPTLAYTSSGYCEFELSGIIYSCWFENGGLSQLNIELKNTGN
jgi:hypothetical protein